MPTIPDSPEDKVLEVQKYLSSVLRAKSNRLSANKLMQFRALLAGVLDSALWGQFLVKLSVSYRERCWVEGWRLNYAGQPTETKDIMLSPWLLSSLRRENMREIQLGSHTVQSHGVKVAKIHKHDWFIVVLLMMLVITLNIIHPFHRFVGKDMMTDLKYPLKSNTVPVWAVPIISVLLPAAVFLAVYFLRRDVYDLHHAILGLLFSVLITGVITDALKDAVGRPRPDFYWRCFPDRKELYDQVTGNVICHGDRSLLKDGHKSFPSGHTSWSFAGLGFLALYSSGKIKAFDQRGHVAKLCIVFLPLLLASLVGISRVDDYRHHWQDVFAGGLLGIIVAAFCYLQFYPAPYHTDGWGPYAYFQMLESSRASGNATNAANQQPEGSNNIILRGAYHDNMTEANDLESGRV